LLQRPCENSPMVLVRFAAHLQSHVPCPDQDVDQGGLGDCLLRAFAAAPAMKDYVLDNQGHIRKHVAVFINGKLHRDRGDLEWPCLAGDRIDVIQALSGG
jgi:sulfur-carrier protein